MNWFGKQKNLFPLHMIPSKWNVEDFQNLSARKTLISILHTINVMTTDGLATQGARASAIRALVQLPRNIPDSLPEGLSLAPTRLSMYRQWTEIIRTVFALCLVKATSLRQLPLSIHWAFHKTLVIFLWSSIERATCYLCCIYSFLQAQLLIWPLLPRQWKYSTVATISFISLHSVILSNADVARYPVSVCLLQFHTVPSQCITLGHPFNLDMNESLINWEFTIEAAGCLVFIGLFWNTCAWYRNIRSSPFFGACSREKRSHSW